MSLVSFYLFKIATRKFERMYAARILFLLASTAQEESAPGGREAWSGPEPETPREAHADK